MMNNCYHWYALGCELGIYTMTKSEIWQTCGETIKKEDVADHLSDSKVTVEQMQIPYK